MRKYPILLKVIAKAKGMNFLFVSNKRKSLIPFQITMKAMWITYTLILIFDPMRKCLILLKLILKTMRMAFSLILKWDLIMKCFVPFQVIMNVMWKTFDPNIGSCEEISYLLKVIAKAITMKFLLVSNIGTDEVMSYSFPSNNESNVDVILLNLIFVLMMKCLIPFEMIMKAMWMTFPWIIILDLMIKCLIHF